MTVLEKLEKMLQENGMFETQAKEVMKLAIIELNKSEDYKISFGSPDKDYPDILYKLWFKDIKPVALKWINDNIPQAWYKPMFE